MHSAIVAGCFLLLVLIPCLVAVYSSSKEGRSGNSGEHTVAPVVTAARGHSPSRIRTAAAAMAARKEARLAAAMVAERAPGAERPSRLRMAAVAAFSKPEGPSAGQRPSRLHRVATALVYREYRDVQKHVPMVAGDPGSKKQSIRDLRAKHAAAARPGRS